MWRFAGLGKAFWGSGAERNDRVGGVGSSTGSVEQDAGFVGRECRQISLAYVKGSVGLYGNLGLWSKP